MGIGSLREKSDVSRAQLLFIAEVFRELFDLTRRIITTAVAALRVFDEL